MSYWKSTAVVAIALIATCGVAQAIVIEFDANSETTGADATWSHTIGAGSDRILIVGVTNEGADGNITSIKYGIVDLTFAVMSVKWAGSNTNVAQLWYLLNPATGTDDIVVDHVSGGGVTNGAISLANVAQQGPEAIADSTVTTSDNEEISMVITTLTDGAWVVDVVGGGGNTKNWEPNALGMVERFDGITGSAGGAGSTKLVPTAGATTNAWISLLENGDPQSANRMSYALAAWAPVPEPATLALLALGGVAVLARRRRRR